MTLTIMTSDHNINDLNTPQTIHTLTYQTMTATIDATTKLISEAHVSTRKSEDTNMIALTIRYCTKGYAKASSSPKRA